MTKINAQMNGNELVLEKAFSHNGKWYDLVVTPMGDTVIPHDLEMVADRVQKVWANCFNQITPSNSVEEVSFSWDTKVEFIQGATEKTNTFVRTQLAILSSFLMPEEEDECAISVAESAPKAVDHAELLRQLDTPLTPEGKDGHESEEEDPLAQLQKEHRRLFALAARLAREGGISEE